MLSDPRPRILIAEDNRIAALDLEDMVEQCGCLALGPMISVADALDAIRSDPPDGAILDVRLQTEPVWPVVELLWRLRVPLVLATGYDAASLPDRYRHCQLLLKPYMPDDIAQALRQMGAPLAVR